MHMQCTFKSFCGGDRSWRCFEVHECVRNWERWKSEWPVSDVHDADISLYLQVAMRMYLRLSRVILAPYLTFVCLHIYKSCP